VEGIRVLASPPQAPRANAICERVIGTLRREVFDRLLIVNEHHLHQVLTEYLLHYNTARPHRSLGQLTPDQADSRPPDPVNLAEQRIRRKQVLGGLTHEYYIAALPPSGASENAGHGANRISEPHRIRAQSPAPVRHNDVFSQADVSAPLIACCQPAGASRSRLAIPASQSRLNRSFSVKSGDSEPSACASRTRSLPSAAECSQILYRSNTRLMGWPALSPAGVALCWLACRVLLKIVYLLTCRVLSLAVLVFHGDLAKDAELLVLRHENAVLRRHVGRVRYEPADRAWLAALARLVPRWRWAGVFPVTPATLLAWQQRRWRRGSTTRVSGASRDARRQARASPAWSSAWRGRIRCGDTAASTASC
jgi:hypothetical protein